MNPAGIQCRARCARPTGSFRASIYINAVEQTSDLLIATEI